MFKPWMRTGAFFFWFAMPGWAGAAEVIPAAPSRYFNDYAKVVSPATAERLNQMLEDFEKAASSQIVVATFPKMQSDSALEDYTVRVFQAWKVGQKGKDNGAVLFVFVQDRRLRIEAGYGLEGALPDALAKRIIENEIKPHLQRQDFDGGLTAGVTAILQAVRGEYTGTGGTVAQARRSTRRASPFTVFLFLIVILIVMSAIGRRRGIVYHRGRRTIWSGWSGGGWGGGGWSGGGRSGGFSGGGFSGGGGRSGGGGASGSW